MVRRHHQLVAMSDPYDVYHWVPVAGGALRVARAGPPPEEADGVVLAVHGVTSSLMAWRTVARDLTARLNICLLAPDLRGRGQSARLPGPYGFAAHTADLLAVLDHARVERAVLAGHSMGAYAVARLAADHPERAEAVVVVDGGMPYADAPEGDPDTVFEELAVPLTERLPRTFASIDAYADYWAAHPAFRYAWGDDVEAYARYDVEGEPGSMRSVVSGPSVAIDLHEILFDEATRTALDRVRAPIHIVRACRGLRDEPDKPLIPADFLSDFAAKRLDASVESVPKANHYTVVLGTGDGPLVVAGAIERALRQNGIGGELHAAAERSV
jgi:pimeloyl-ACP methyl ester carboxylesterase